MGIELAFTIVGGLIGLLGGLTTTVLTHRLSKSESRRQELLAAYSDWSVKLYEVLEGRDNLKLYDYIEKLKRENPPVAAIADVPSSPAGHSREDLVRTWRETLSRLRSACARLLLLEPDEKYAKRVWEMSDIGSKSPEGLDELIESKKSISAAIEEFLRELRNSHPLLSR